MRLIVLLLSALPLVAGDTVFNVTPLNPKQGEAVRVVAPENATQARMGSRTIPLFLQPDGQRFGLMPVGVLEKTGAYTLEILDASGRVLHRSALIVRSGLFRKQNVVLSKRTSSLRASPDEMKRVGQFRRTVTDVRHWDEPFVSPIPGCMTSPFGVLRLHNGKPTGNYHGGIDQRGPEGQPIHSIAGGTVVVADMFNLHGGTVGIDHGQGLSSIYLHMSKLAVNEGAVVKKGDLIGYVGSTGRSTAPHLHWSLYANTVPVNPLQWVKLQSCSAPPKPVKRRVSK